MRGHDRTSIVTQTAVRVAAIFLCVILIQTAAITNLFYDSLRERMFIDQEQTVGYITKTMEYTFEGLVVPMVMLSRETAAKRLLADRNEKYSAAWIEDVRALDTFLKNTSMFNDYIVDIVLIKPDSSVAYSLSGRFNDGYDYVAKPWFQDAMAEDGPVKYAIPDDAYTNADLEYSFVALYCIERSGKAQGYVLVEVNLREVERIFKGLSKDAQFGYLLVNENGKLLFDYKKRLAQEADVIARRTGDAVQTLQAHFIENGKYYTIQKLGIFPWYAVGESDYRQVVAPITKILPIVVLLVAAALAVLFLLTALMSRMMRRPMDALLARMSRYEGQKAEPLGLDQRAPKEIAVISERFEEMAGRMNSLIHDVYLAQMHRKEMELEALMNQINPHFLYNALQLIQTRAVLDENREIEDMVTSLGSMLHYTMNKSSEYVCLDEELAYIENYLAFYKARFHARFTYEILCSDEARACRTLKFILQPIVENCFTHGLRDKKAGGVLSVRVEEAGEALLLHVYDNGSGIAPDRLAALRAALASEAPGGASYGIGLLNTHARIRLVYGPGCGVGVTSIEGEYTEVSIRIPREVQQDV